MAFVPALRAGTFSFTGNLATDATFLPPGAGPFVDGDYAQWAAVVRTFHLDSPSAMQAVTFSYGGGTNGNGTSIAKGGFAPYLSLFDGSGNFLASTFFGVTCPPGANINPSSGHCYDVLLDGGILPPNDYQIAISAFQNLSFAENSGTGTLAGGFTGLGNLFPGEDLHYAFDVILPGFVSVPEPPTSWSVAASLALLFYLSKAIHRKRKEQNQ
jgi:hypothetical protein